MKKLLLLVSFLMTCSIGWGQFSLDAQIRPRFEFRNGYNRLPSPDSNPAAQFNQRTRLNLTYLSDSRVSTRISIQDVRIWGQDLQLTHVPSFDLYEAWVKLQLSDNWAVQAGRQELKYDNQRLLSFNDWALPGRTHDAVVFQYDNDAASKLHVGLGLNQSQNRMFETHYGLNHYKTLNYIWYNTRISTNTTASLLAIADGYEHPDNPDKLYIRGTWSAYMQSSPGNYSFTFNPAYQHGNTRTGQDISAWFVTFEASARLTGSYSGLLGFELFSGNDGVNPGDTYTAFSDLYGIGHARHGFMDYFTSFPAHTLGAGLFNPYFKNTFRLSDQTVFTADLHLFYIQNDYPDPVNPGQSIDYYLGSEIDLVLSYRFNDFTRLMFGYSVMFGTESMEVIKGGSKDEFAHWAFVMITMTPRFL